MELAQELRTQAECLIPVPLRVLRHGKGSEVCSEGREDASRSSDLRRAQLPRRWLLSSLLGKLSVCFCEPPFALIKTVSEFSAF